MTGLPDDDRIPESVSPPSIPEFSYDDIEKGNRVGTGGDADVYRATVARGGNTYTLAVKEPRFEGTIGKRVVERFHEEAETWGGLDDHENVVTVHDYDTTPLPWLALEFMDRGTLEGRIGEVDLAEGLWLARSVAEGIRHGHRHGIAHLDIKPTNVLLRGTPSGTWDYPKVSDWGLAKLLIEHSKSVEGLSPTYAAPEQFDADRYGRPDDITDVYQFGAVVYALLTGRPPFTGAASAVMRQVLEATPDPPSTHDPAVPSAVDDVVLRALRKDKQERYESIILLRRELDRLLAAHLTGELGSSGPSDTAGGRNDPPGNRRPPSEGSGASAAGASASTTGPAAGDSGSSAVSRRAALGALGVGVAGVGAYAASRYVGGDGTEPAAEDASGTAVRSDVRNTANTGGTASVELSESWSDDGLWGAFATDGRFVGEGASPDGGHVNFVNGSGENVYVSGDIGPGYLLELNQGATIARNRDLVFAAGTASPRTEKNNARLAAFSGTGDVGRRQWTHHTEDTGTETRIEHVCADEDAVYYATTGEGGGSDQRPVVRAVAAGSNAVEWERVFDGSFFRGLVRHGSTLFVGRSQTLELLDPATGEVKRRIELGTSALGGMARVGDTLYVVDTEIKAYGLDSGKERWTVTRDREPDTPIATADGALYAGTDAGYVTAHGLGDGTKLWETRAEQSIETKPAAADGVVWVADAAGNVSGFDGTSGEQVYQGRGLDEPAERTSIAALDSVLFVTGLYTGNVSGTAYAVG